MIDRERHLERLRILLTRYPVVAILGARQVGKTTLARELTGRIPDKVTRFDLEDPDDLARLAEPKLALAELEGLVVIDEVQRQPDIFRVLRVLADRPDAPARFLILGSASRELLRQSSESLAGRIAYHGLDGFALDEVGVECRASLWARGGFPRSFLAESEEASYEWRKTFVRTFLEQDLPQLGVQIPAPTLHRFWTMLAHYHGQTWNGAELARAFAVSATTVRRYLDILTSALVVKQLAPWFENVSKRQVRSPKVYLADAGLLHALLGIRSTDELEKHPKVGASWEGFALSQVVTRLGVPDEECYFWATHAGAELDLLVMRGTQRLGFEFKRTSRPSTSRSMRAAIESLQLDRLDVIHAGENTFPLADDIRAVSIDRILTDLADA